MLRGKTWVCGLAFFAAGAVSGMWLVTNEDPVPAATRRMQGIFGVSTAQAEKSKKSKMATTEEPKISPVKARPLDVYFPNTENLAKYEMAHI